MFLRQGVWAPEAVFCKEKDMWFVFFASNVKENGDKEPKQRIYGTFTKDFNEFTPTFKYIDGETALIDTNIVWDNGWYYRFTKDETNKFIIIERSKNLVGDDYNDVLDENLNIKILEKKSLAVFSAFFIIDFSPLCK